MDLTKIYLVLTSLCIMPRFVVLREQVVLGRHYWPPMLWLGLPWVSLVVLGWSPHRSSLHLQDANLEEKTTSRGHFKYPNL